VFVLSNSSNGIFYIWKTKRPMFLPECCMFGSIEQKVFISIAFPSCDG